MIEIETILAERPGRLHKAVACELCENDGQLLNSGVVLNVFSWDRHTMREITYPVLQRPRLFTPVDRRAFRQKYHSNDKFQFYLKSHGNGYTINMVLPTATHYRWRFIFQDRFSSTVSKLRMELTRSARFKPMPLYVCDWLGFDELNVWDWNQILEGMSRAVFDVFSITYVVLEGQYRSPISFDPVEEQ